MTSFHESFRPLTPQENAVLLGVLELQDFPGREELREQALHAAVRGGTQLALDLVVVAEVPAAPVDPGPIPIRVVALSPSGELIGEVIVWTTEGYLSGLEFAWYTDEAPTSLPGPEQLTVDDGGELPTSAS